MKLFTAVFHYILALFWGFPILSTNIVDKSIKNSRCLPSLYIIVREIRVLWIKVNAMKFDEFRKKYMETEKPRKKPRHIEEDIQSSCVQWFRLSYPRYVIFACPNGGSRNRLEAINMKRSGVLAGVSDLIIIAERAVLFVEMKTKTGRQSESQKRWQKAAEEQGYRYVVCRSLEEFMKEVNDYGYFEKTEISIRSHIDDLLK